MAYARPFPPGDRGGEDGELDEAVLWHQSESEGEVRESGEERDIEPFDRQGNIGVLCSLFWRETDWGHKCI